MTDQEMEVLGPAEPTQESCPAGPDEVDQARARITELEHRLAAKENYLVLKDQRISELESTVSSLRQDLTESNGNLTKLQEDLSQAVASYRALAVQSNPDVLEELIGGDSIEAINGSLKSARELVGKVKQSLASEIVSTRIPTGAPPRTAPDLSALSPREKIHYALGK